MKKNKSIFMAILGGLALCLICVGIVSLFQNKTQNNMEGNEELPLGDTQVSCVSSETTCPDGYQVFSGNTNQCIGPTNGKSASECTGSNEIYYQGMACYPLVNSTTVCTSCGTSAYLNDGKCYTCGSGTHLVSSGCVGSSCCAPDPSVTPAQCLAQNQYYSPNRDSCMSCAHTALKSTTTACSGNEIDCCQDDATYCLSQNMYVASGSSGECVACPSGFELISTSTGCTGTQYNCCIESSVTCYLIENNACVERQVAADSCDRNAGIYTTVTMCDANLATTLPKGSGKFVNPATHAVENCDANYSNIPQCSGTKASCCVSNAAACASLGSTSCGARSDCEYDSGNGCHDINKTCYTFSNNSCQTTSVQFSTTCASNNLYYTENDCVNDNFGCWANANSQGINNVVWTTNSNGEASHLAKLDGIDRATCEAMHTEVGKEAQLCFKDSDNNYYWGYNYANSSYTHVPNVTSEDACGSDQPKQCYCDGAGNCVLQTATSSTFYNLSDIGNCTITGINGHKIIALSGSGSEYGIITDVYTATTANGSNLGRGATWSKSSSYQTLGNDCESHYGTCSITYRNHDACSSETVTVNTSYEGYGNATLNVQVYHFNDWSDPTHPVLSQEQHDRLNGHTREAEKYMTDCDAYENWVYNDTTGYWTVDKYYRCCGGGGESNPTPTATTTPKYDFCCKKDDGTNYVWKTNQTTYSCQDGYTIDETKDSTTCKNAVVVVDKCYQDSDGGYHWTSAPEASWVIVDLNSTQCKNEPACYESPSGVREWGLLYNKVKEGYKLITSIKDEELCTNPTENDACYVNNSDPTDYKWSSTAPEGYTKVELDSDACQPELCYLNSKTDKWEFGKYANTPGFYKIEKEDGTLITSADECITPLEGCYKDKNGNHEWGDYSKDPDYTFIPELKTPSQCNPEIPTPKTDIDTARIVYIFMAILMAAGVAFIYYSAIAKKHE